jgi:predicted SprT family Zn-dependent metalloprotease
MSTHSPADKFAFSGPAPAPASLRTTLLALGRARGWLAGSSPASGPPVSPSRPRARAQLIAVALKAGIAGGIGLEVEPAPSGAFELALVEDGDDKNSESGVHDDTIDAELTAMRTETQIARLNKVDLISERLERAHVFDVNGDRDVGAFHNHAEDGKATNADAEVGKAKNADAEEEECDDAFVVDNASDYNEWDGRENEKSEFENSDSDVYAEFSREHVLSRTPREMRKSVREANLALLLDRGQLDFASSDSDSSSGSESDSSADSVRSGFGEEVEQELVELTEPVSIERSLNGWMKWLGRDAGYGAFADQRVTAAERLMTMFDNDVLDGRLKGSVSLRWNNRLTKTAGVTVMKRTSSDISIRRMAVVELSTKVVDDAERLYGTLAHELCHAAAWVLDGVSRPPHGVEFKRWARVFQEYDGDLHISTCHSYAILYPFVYECGGCGYEFGRHSMSIDTDKKVCGRCQGALTLRSPEVPVNRR